MVGRKSGVANSCPARARAGAAETRELPNVGSFRQKILRAWTLLVPDIDHETGTRNRRYRQGGVDEEDTMLQWRVSDVMSCGMVTLPDHALPSDTGLVLPRLGRPTTQPTPPTASRRDELDETLAMDIVDEWGRQSFPASDPPANW
jgi:hypothetical protein